MQKFLTAVVIVAVLGIGYWWWQGSSAPATTSETNSEMTGSSNIPEGAVMEDGVVPDETSDAPMTATIIYNGDSFSPSSVTIRKGGTVTWTNTSGGRMWVASAQLPTHAVYDGTSREEHCPNTLEVAFDECAGETGNYSFKFEKTGTWNYHDHINSNLFGKVIVE